MTEDEVVLAVPAIHHFVGRSTVVLAELTGDPFVEHEGGSGTLLSLRRALVADGLGLPAYPA